jgi:hypothetical protein
MASQPGHSFDAFFDGLVLKFASDESNPAALRFTKAERMIISSATRYYASRCGPGEFQSPGLCFIATKIVRVIAEANGMRAEPLTVSLHAQFEGQDLTLGARRPRLTRVRKGSSLFHLWSGHEIVHFPTHRAVYDPTTLQLTTKHSLALPVFPVAAEAPATLKPGDKIEALLEPLGVNAVYRVEHPNYDYTQLPAWKDVLIMADQGVGLVGEILSDHDML